MQDDTPGEVTRLLKAWCKGDARALERLAPMVEQELRRLARAYLQREAAGHTLQPTALVNEAYLRLLDWNAVEWRDRAHFLAVAAKMMRRILLNARRSLLRVPSWARWPGSALEELWAASLARLLGWAYRDLRQSDTKGE